MALLNRLSFDKVMQVAVEAIHMSDEKAMRGALIHFEVAARYEPRGLSRGQLQWRGYVRVAMNDQRRRGDFGQLGPEVRIGDGSVAIKGCFQ